LLREKEQPANPAACAQAPPRPVGDAVHRFTPALCGGAAPDDIFRQSVT